MSTDFEKRLIETDAEVTAYIKRNKIDNDVLTTHTAFIKQLVSIESYITFLDSHLKSVITTNKIDSAFIAPKIILLCIDIRKKISTFLNDTEKNITDNELKYLLYGSLYYYIITYQPEYFNETNTISDFRDTYDKLWDLVSIGITIEEDSKAVCCWCC